MDKLEQVWWGASPVRRGWGSEACTAWGRGGFRGTRQQPPLYEEVTEKTARLTTEVQRGRIKDSGLTLKWDSKENKYFHWEVKEASLGRSRLPGEVVRAPSLEVLKICLNKALNSLMWSHGRPCFEQGAGLETSWDPVQPDLRCDDSVE